MGLGFSALPDQRSKLVPTADQPLPERVYVVLTGIPLRSWVSIQFLRKAAPALQASRKAEGNLYSAVRSIDGYQHTLTVWRDTQSVGRYVMCDAHRQAMDAADNLRHETLPLKHFGYWTTPDKIPSWAEFKIMFDEYPMVKPVSVKASDLVSQPQ